MSELLTERSLSWLRPAMIGAAAVYHHLFGKPDDWYNVQANPNLEL